MHLFFSVGEPSGDQHAARLIRELRSRLPNLQVSGFGGPLMEQAGCKLHFRLVDLAVMGFFRVLPMLGRFYSLICQAETIFRAEHPDAVVLVDFPGFNWWIARKAKQLNIPVFYYLPPQLWAWAPWRVKRIKRNVDHVLCGLPFEEQWYRERGVAAEYVGHPFFDEVAEHQFNHEFLARWKAGSHRVIGILPGSRNHEVEQNFPVMIAVIRQLAAQHLDTVFLVACFSEPHRTKCQTMLGDQPQGASLPIHLFVGKTPEIIHVSECCLMVSGSVSLEMVARETPAVVIYYLNRLSRLLIHLLVKCKFASLPNLMVNRELLPEYFPEGDGEIAAQQAARTISSWLSDERELAVVRRQLRLLHKNVGQTGSIARAAAAIVRRLPGRERRDAA